MLPFEARETVDLPGDNAAYRREALLAVRDTYRDGFWEPDVNRALPRRGLSPAPLAGARRLPGTLGRLPRPSCASARARPRLRTVSAACASRAAGTRSGSRPRSLVPVRAARADGARGLLPRPAARPPALWRCPCSSRTTSRGRRERPPGIWIASVVDDGSRALGRGRVGERASRTSADCLESLSVVRARRRGDRRRLRRTTRLGRSCVTPGPRCGCSRSTSRRPCPRCGPPGIFAAHGAVRRADRGPLPRDACAGRRRAASPPTARGHSVVGGPIRNVATRRDPRLGGLLLRVQPLHGAAARRARSDDLTGMNVSYDRARARGDRRPPARGALGDVAASASARARLRALLLEPDMVLEHDKDFGFGEFLSQRYHYRRSYAGMRNPTLGREALAVRARLPAARRRFSTGASRGTSSRAPATGGSSRSATPLDPALHGRVGGRRGGRLRRSAAGAACSGAVGDAGRRRRDELGEPARLRALRPQRGRPARRARRGVDVHARSSTTASASEAELPADGGRVRRAVSAGRRRRRRRPSPTGRSRTCSGSRAPPRAHGSTSCSFRPSTRGFPSSARRRSSACTTLIAEELPGADVPVSARARLLAAQALERDAERRAACSPSPRRRAR